MSVQQPLDFYGSSALATIMAAATNAHVDISARLWASGVYMLHLSKDGAAHLEKVVKE